VDAPNGQQRNRGAAGGELATHCALSFISPARSASTAAFTNFGIDGTPYWSGIQLTRSPFRFIWRTMCTPAPRWARSIRTRWLLAARPLPVNRRPVTPQGDAGDSGYSPSTLASNIAALVCASDLAARNRGDRGDRRVPAGLRDFLESHIERWTVTNQGFVVPGIKRHYIASTPQTAQVCPMTIPIKDGPIRNRPPGAPNPVPGGRDSSTRVSRTGAYGIRAPADPLIGIRCASWTRR